jgi:hypothetical protein
MAESLEVAEVRERLRTDTPFWASQCAWILNEDKVPVKLLPRPWQARTPETPRHIVPIDEALEKQRAAGQPMRAIVLKARKLGFSTWVAAKFMQRVTQFPHQYAIVAAHDRKTGSILADMAALMYGRLPTYEELGLGFSIRPQLLGKGETRNGSRHMVLGDRKRPYEASMYETLTAGARAGGRGYTPSMLHCSEMAHWEDVDVIPGMLNSVPKRPGTMVVIESTASGFNHFYNRWQRAVAGAEDPETGGLYVPLFYGWQDNPFNSLPFINDAARERFAATVGDEDGGGDPEEPHLIETFGVTLEQLRWRRVTISEECEGSIEVFHQEHPTTPEEAFIGSGDPVFPGILVSRALKEAEAAGEPVEGVLRGADWKERRTRAGTVLVPQRAIWVPRDQMSRTPWLEGDDFAHLNDFDVWGTTHRLRVWEHPVNAETQVDVPTGEVRPDGQYVAFADVAQGEGATAEERDFHAIQVLDHLSKMQVLSYRSRIALSDFPLVLLLVGLYFNGAWLAPEANGPGIGVVDALVKDYHYKRVYRRRRAGDDRRGDETGYLMGFLTDRRTKPLMEMTFGQALKEGTHGLRCVQTGREATTYVSDERGRHGAQKGAFDDLLMAFMGAHRVADEIKPRSAGTGRRSGGRRTVVDDVTGW